VAPDLRRLRSGRRGGDLILSFALPKP